MVYNKLKSNKLSQSSSSVLPTKRFSGKALADDSDDDGAPSSSSKIDANLPSYYGSNSEGSNLEVVVAAVNLRSIYNVGSILRTCDGFGIKEFIAIGSTPYPEIKGDQRLPHIKIKLASGIAKTALGAEKNITTYYFADLTSAADSLKGRGFDLVFLEQTKTSEMLDRFKPKHGKLALFLGPEATGFNSEELALADIKIEIPMRGKKESFNVSVAAGIALYQITLNIDN